VVLARDWIAKNSRKVTGPIQSFVVLRPKATAALAIAVVLAASGLFWTGRVVGDYREKRHNEWRLRQMTDAVRQADERVRSRLTPSSEDDDGEYRGVFETMREPTEPPPATDGSTVPEKSESKP
jgi:hypothetical protein